MNQIPPANPRTPQISSTLLDDLEVPLAIGTLQWGTTAVDNSLINPNGVISESDAQQIVDFLTQGGVRVWDTAEGYGGGTSEKRLARTLPKSAIVMTKFLPAPWRSSHASFEAAVRASAKRLGVETIPIYLLHSPVHRRPIEHWIESAALCKKKGLLNFMGISNCDADQVRRAVAAGKKYGVDVILNQAHYSLLDYNSPALQEMQQVCQELGVKVVGFSPIGQGLLTDKLTEENFSSNRPAKMYGLGWDDVQPLRARLKEMSAKYKKTMAQVALNWCICHDVLPLVGCRSLKQAKDSLGSVGWKLEDDDVRLLDELALTKSRLGGTGWKRGFFVGLFGVVMVVCRTLDYFGFGMVKQAIGETKDETKRKES